MKSVHRILLTGISCLLTIMPAISQGTNTSAAPSGNNRRMAVPVCNMGNLFLVTGNLDGAVKKFSEAIEIDPTFDRAYHSLGIAYIKQGDLDKAITTLQKATELNPSGANWTSLGKAYEKKNSAAEAEKAYRKAVELEPTSLPSSLALGDYLRKQKKFDEAKKILAKAQSSAAAGTNSAALNTAIEKCDKKDASE